MRWTAPEALEDRKYSSKSDCWSYGIVLYEIWTRADTPYKDMNNQKVWMSVLAGYRLPQPPECPDAIYQIMLTCWSDQPNQRPTFQELAGSIRQLQTDLQIEIRRASEYRTPDFLPEIPMDQHVYVDFTNGNDIVPKEFDRVEFNRSKVRRSFLTAGKLMAARNMFVPKPNTASIKSAKPDSILEDDSVDMKPLPEGPSFAEFAV